MPTTHTRMMEMKYSRITLWMALFLVVLVACPAFAAEKKHKEKRTEYLLSDFPSGWKSIHIAKADMAFQHETEPVSVLVNSTCKVYTEAPLKALTSHLLIDITDREVENWTEGTIDGRTAQFTVVQGKLDGADVKMDLRVVKIDSCVFDFAYVAPLEAYGAAHDDFEAMVQGFHVQRVSE